MFHATLLGMAVVAAATAGYRAQTVPTGAIALIVDKCPCPVQRSGPEVIRILFHDIAGRIADCTIDTFYAGAGSYTPGICRIDLRHWIAAAVLMIAKSAA